MIDYSKIMEIHYSGKRYQWVGDTYEGFEWYEDEPKPTKDELDSLWESTQTAIAQRQQAAEEIRQSARAKLAALGLTAEEITALGK